MGSSRVVRYLSLFLLSLRVSFAIGAQYRYDFLLDGLLSVVFTALGLVPLAVALHGRPHVAGWTFDEGLVVFGVFTVLKGVLEGAVNPSLTTVVDQIRKGTLDFVLMKPADAQFLVSTSRFEIWKAIDLPSGLAIVAWAFARMGRVPTPTQATLSLVLMTAGIVVLYTIWILVIAAAFWVVRLDNLSYLFNSLFDFARWPVTIFPRPYRLVFTVVIPLAIMTTFPAEALIGTLDPRWASLAVGGALVFAAVGRLIWTRAIAHYTSASS